MIHLIYLKKYVFFVHFKFFIESALMSEIRELVNDGSCSNQGPKTVKNVRFQSNNKAKKAVDSGIESCASSVREEGGGRNRENWLKRLTEQRQSYYDNVNQLLNYMKNRNELPTSAVDQRSNSQQSFSALSTTPDPNPSFPQPDNYQQAFLQQLPSQAISNPPSQTRPSSQANVHQPSNVQAQPGSNMSSSNRSQPPARLINQRTVHRHQPSSQSNVPSSNLRQESTRNQTSISQQYLTQSMPSSNSVQELERDDSSSTVLQQHPPQPSYPYQQPPLLNFQSPNEQQQPASSNTLQNPQPFIGQPNVQYPAQFQTNTNGNPPQYQPTLAQLNPPWNAQLHGFMGQMNPSNQTVPTCLCGGLPQYLSQANVPNSTYQPHPNQLLSSQAYQSQFNVDQQSFQAQRSGMMTSTGTQVMGPSDQQMGRSGATNVQDRRTQTESATVSDYVPTAEELSKLPEDLQSWAGDIIEEKRKLKEKNTELRLELDGIAESSQKSDEKVNETADKLKKAEDLVSKLKSDLESANNKTRNLEQGLQAERNNLQQLRLDIDAADGNSSSLTKKYVEKATQLDSAKQLCSMLEQNVATLEDQVSSLKNQLQALQVSYFISCFLFFA